MENESLRILKKSVENLKGEALRKAKELEELDSNKTIIEREIQDIVGRIESLNASIEILEKGQDGTYFKTSSKSKKAKS